MNQDLVESVKKIAKKIEEFGGNRTMVLDVSKKNKEINYMVITNAFNQQMAKFMAGEVQGYAKELGFEPVNIDGIIKGEWIVIDYDKFLVHIFVDATRSKYNIEKLWEDSKNKISY